MLYQTIPLLKEKLLSELKANSFEERDKQLQQSQPQSLSITYLTLQKVQPEIRTIFQKYFSKIQSLVIANCDLRTFENFPCLPELLELDASKNSLQGTFEYLVKNRALEYIDVSDNFIKDAYRLQPLKCLKNAYFCLKNNPVLNQNNHNLIKTFGNRMLKEPKTKQVIKEESEKQENLQKKNSQQQNVKKKEEENQNQNEYSSSQQIQEHNFNPFTIEGFADRLEDITENHTIKIRHPRFSREPFTGGKFIKKVMGSSQLTRIFLQRQRLRKEEEQLEKQLALQLQSEREIEKGENEDDDEEEVIQEQEEEIEEDSHELEESSSSEPEVV